MLLTREQVRVLGCLVEKQQTTPQQYPLSENAVVLACNQSTGRDPITDYDRDTVRTALVGLRQEGLARTMHRPGDRTEKHAHLLADALGLAPRQLAVLAVLALRGPQTSGELRTRTERMHAFASVDEVEAVLSELAQHPAQLAVRLERQPGQHQVRWVHLLEGEPVLTAVTDPTAAPAAVRPGGGIGAELAALRAEVEQLRAEVDVLRAAVETLRADESTPRTGTGGSA